MAHPILIRLFKTAFSIDFRAIQLPKFDPVFGFGFGIVKPGCGCQFSKYSGDQIGQRFKVFSFPNHDKGESRNPNGYGSHHIQDQLGKLTLWLFSSSAHSSGGSVDNSKNFL